MTFVLRAIDRALSSKQSVLVFMLAFVAVLSCMPPSTVLTGNEEAYFAMALQWWAPDQLPDPSVVRGGMVHLFAYKTLAGWLVATVGFEAAQVISAFAVAALYAFSLMQLARVLGLDVAQVAVVLLAFVGLGATSIGDELLFDGFEAKHLAYCCVISGAAAYLDRRWLVAGVWLAGATLFHFLVGGFWGGVIAFHAIAVHRRLADATRLWPWFVVTVGFAAWLFAAAYGDFVSGAEVETDRPLSWIMSVYRAPINTMPFLSVWSFLEWAPGIVLVVALTILSAVLGYRSEGRIRTLWQIVLLTHLWLLLALALSLFDEEGKLGIYFPFRPSSLGLLLAIFALATRLYAVSTLGTAKLRIWLVFLLGAMVLPQHAISKALYVSEGFDKRDAKQALYEFVRGSTASTDVFVIEPESELALLDFERGTSRSVLVMFKYLPSDAADIQTWYRTLTALDRLVAEGCPSPVNSDFLVTGVPVSKRLAETCGPIVYSDTKFAVIRLTEPQDAPGT